ncbi:Very-long-chain (3R)-3-hydroxyacyl-CoA dehydratase PHS1 [Dictyocoela muelleri]|nr:Very-long-chain (3R)-3-hydroxyacyl-CoA dehydratase PHS1 [Dictyocoela muelleri]
MLYLKTYNFIGLVISAFLLLQGILLLFSNKNIINRSTGIIFNNRFVNLILNLNFVRNIFRVQRFKKFLNNPIFKNIFERKTILRNIFLGQMFFITEFFNSLIKASKSPISSVSLQLLSRIFVSFLLFSANNYENHVIASTKATKSTLSISILFICWYTADLIRYSYYFFKTDCLKKLRYNAFLILYPIGLIFEIYFVNSFESVVGDKMSMFLKAVMIFYLPGFFYLYFYMIRRRRISLRRRTKKNRA